MPDRRYTISVEVKDNKKDEIVEAYKKDVDGYLYLNISGGEITSIGGADFAKVLGPLISEAIVKKFGGQQ